MATQDCEIHVGDIGTVFEITLQDCSVDPAIPVDLTAATTIEIIFQKPPSTKVVKTGVVVNPPGTDGLIKYTSVADDLDKNGTWKIQARVVFPTGEWRSSVDEFIVHPNIVL